MNTVQSESTKPSKEQLIYANLLLIGVLVGIITMFTTYTIYLTGILPAHVDTQLITSHWGTGIHEYLEVTNTPNGWGWTYLLGKGDFLNYIGFALLGLMTVLCYLVLVKGFLRQKNWIFLTISVLEIVVLSLAASGLLGGGAH